VGQTLALAIPLAAMLAHSVSIADIFLWGLIAMALQFIAVIAARLLVPDLPQLIQRGEVAPALVAACGAVVTGLMNAAVMSG
jgi:putative membrane protein